MSNRTLPTIMVAALFAAATANANPEVERLQAQLREQVKSMTAYAAARDKKGTPALYEKREESNLERYLRIALSDGLMLESHVKSVSRHVKYTEARKAGKTVERWDAKPELKAMPLGKVNYLQGEGPLVGFVFC